MRISFLRNARPSLARPSGVGARGRHTAAARAISFTSVEKDSMTSVPSNFTFFSAAAISAQATCPVPGVPRSFSFACMCTMSRPAASMALPRLFSSMLAWKVSIMSFTRGLSIMRISSMACSVRLMKLVSNLFSGSRASVIPLSSA